MEHTLAFPPRNATDLDADPAVNVLIAYENFEAGKHAKQTYDSLVQNLGNDFQFTSQMWKFDVLLVPKLRDIAVDDASRADVIIISSCGRELPPHVIAWIESWLAAAQNPLALVALFQPASQETSRVNKARQYLAEAARRGNIEFFAQPEPGPSPEFRTDNDSRLADKTLSTLADAVQRDLHCPRWTMSE